MGIEAQTELDKSKAEYQALIQECKAEKANLDAINAQRKHEYEMKLAEAYKTLGDGRNTKIVMSGENGEKLIDKIFNFDA